MATSRKKKTVLVLGAGFSRPAGGPLLRDLLRPDDVRQKSKADKALHEVARRLAIVTQGDPAFDLEAEFTRIVRAEQMQQPYTLGAERWDAEDLGWALRRHIVRACSVRVDFRRHDTVKLYTNFINAIGLSSSHLSVVTFNYDQLVEHFFDKGGVPWSHAGLKDIRYADEGRRRRVTRDGGVPILKLHGSVTWGLCLGCTRTSSSCLVIAFEKPYAPDRRLLCGRCKAGLLYPGIVPPVKMKSHDAALFLDAWKAARRLLTASERVVVVGYSLPAGDEEARNLLSGLGDGGREIVVVCGKGGAVNHGAVMGSVTDAHCRLEEFVVRHAVTGTGN